MFNPVELIIRKRNGNALSPQDIHDLVAAYTQGQMPDYQMSAFLMATFLNGLSQPEAAALTESMLHSGIVLDLSDIPGVKVDKHSTGGVGDKISLILAPIVAACGVPVPMISGRGLGHSGGTLDKLESIPGFRVDLDIDTYRKQLGTLGLVMIGQTDEIAPADRKMYALRDVTGTVECIPLIASSIMSKKLAEGIDGLVLDVKCGKGAFMKSTEDAERLAKTLMEISTSFGKSVVAWMTAMDQPLGYAIGNWLEVEESIRCLQGEYVEDLMELTYTLAGEMIFLGKVAHSPEEGRDLAEKAVSSGKAFEKFVELVDTQGGDVHAVMNPGSMPMARVREIVLASVNGGYITSLDSLTIGKAGVQLGAGRRTKEDAIDPTAGVTLHKKEGDFVHPNEPLATLYTNQDVDVSAINAYVKTAFTFSDKKPPPRPLLMQRYAMIL